MRAFALIPLAASLVSLCISLWVAASGRPEAVRQGVPFWPWNYRRHTCEAMRGNYTVVYLSRLDGVCRSSDAG